MIFIDSKAKTLLCYMPIVICLLSLMSPIVQANHPSHSNKLSVLTEQWFPFNYKNADGDIVGSNTEAVHEIMTLSQLPYEIYIHNWKNALLQTQRDSNTLLFTIFKTPEREQKFHWLCPISTKITNSFYALSNRDISINSLEELKQYSVAITEESYPQHLLIESGFVVGENLQLVSTNDNSIERLLRKRVDIIVETENAINTELAEKSIARNTVKKVYSLDYDKQLDACMAINKNVNPETLKKLKQAHQQWLKRNPQISSK
ncbi:MAG: transporter substrate-binding domain-containing protein [Gammaproteobacteria bacterium]|nr:transporter substrate-binding domain-containing protein [Gammaproteobacteria bacterium]